MIVIIGGAPRTGKTRLASLLKDGYDGPFVRMWKMDPLEDFSASILHTIEKSSTDTLVIIVVQGSIDLIAGRISNEPQRGFGDRTPRSMWNDIVGQAVKFNLC